MNRYFAAMAIMATLGGAQYAMSADAVPPLKSTTTIEIVFPDGQNIDFLPTGRAELRPMQAQVPVTAMVTDDKAFNFADIYKKLSANVQEERGLSDEVYVYFASKGEARGYILTDRDYAYDLLKDFNQMPDKKEWCNDRIGQKCL